MKRLAVFVGVLLLAIAIADTAAAQEDVRSATRMPIPIGADVIWGHVELRGLRADEARPSIVVQLIYNGVQVDSATANDKGYYYFLQRARAGGQLVLRVGGLTMGQLMTADATERYDMSINWSDYQSAKTAGVVSAKDAYTSRSDANQKLLDKAMDAASNKKVGEAIKLMLEIVAADPNDFIAWAGLGSLYRSESKLSDAEKAYDRALQLKPDLMIALVNIGKLHASNKAYEKAIAVLVKAVAADPTSADAFQLLGESYLLAKLGSKAVPALNEAIRLAPVEKADLHLRLAFLYNAAGLKDRAAAEYKAFLIKRPDHADKKKLEEYIKANAPK
jgi:cytochrome c-type biogenesis protein CcmH/NrfG